MLDIRLIREQPDFVKSRLATRGGGDEAKIDEVLAVDAERRRLETALQQANAERKRLSKEIGGARSRGEDASEAEERVRKIGDEIAGLVSETDAAEARQRDLLLNIPNLPHAGRADRKQRGGKSGRAKLGGEAGIRRPGARSRRAGCEASALRCRAGHEAERQRVHLFHRARARGWSGR